MSEVPLFEVEVEIQDLQKTISIDSTSVEELVRFVLGRESHGGRIGICFVDDERITQLHGDFLGDQSATDVITFPLEKTVSRLLDGEIVISTETADRQAQERGWAPLREVHLYLIHGLLHLLGHDDIDVEGSEAMKRLQEAHLNAWIEFRGPLYD